ncbi:MAG: hypothetical protein SNJ60_04140 [Pseudanabaenaceae cyanobacterium]
MSRLGMAIALFGLSLAIAVFSGQNLQVVNVQWLGGRSPALPLGLVLVFMAGLGSTLVFAWPAAGRRPRPRVPPRQTREPPPKAAARDWETEDAEAW